MHRKNLSFSSLRKIGTRERYVENEIYKFTFFNNQRLRSKNPCE